MSSCILHRIVVTLCECSRGCEARFRVLCDVAVMDFALACAAYPLLVEISDLHLFPVMDFVAILDWFLAFDTFASVCCRCGIGCCPSGSRFCNQCNPRALFVLLCVHSCVWSHPLFSSSFSCQRLLPLAHWCRARRFWFG